MIDHGPRQIIFGILIMIPLRYLGAQLPESFEHVVSFGGTNYTAALEFYSNRGPNFEVTKSFFFGIVGTEYILRWLPIGTHAWNKFIKPEELEKVAQGVIDI